MNGNYVVAWILSAGSLAVAALAIRGLIRGRKWKGDGTWLMVSLVAFVGVFAVFMWFAAANIQARGDECAERGGKFVRYLGCVDPATNAPLPADT